MLTTEKLYTLAKSRFDEANILLKNHKPDGAVYLVGYALELILKQRIVKNLGWDGYPDTSGEFKDYKSFKVHNLDVLLHLSGLEKELQTDNTLLARWQIAKSWDSEIRYKETGKISGIEAKDILEATRTILNFLHNHK